MSGLGIRLYTDEMVDVRLAEQLRRHGYDAVSCREVGRHNRRISDADQLSWATTEGRAVLTHNYGDFLRIDADWKAQGRTHAGIILTPWTSDVGELQRRVTGHLERCAPEEQHDVALWLSSTSGA